MRTSTHLIIGSDGQVGSALLAHFQRLGTPVIGTTRRSERVDSSHMYLDLLSDFAAWRPPCPVNVAVVAAAITKVERCRKDPAATWDVNVRGTVDLVRQLVRHGAFVVFLSTNLVFDGSMPFVPADHPPSPVTEYGRQKAAVERSICGLGNSVAMVRFTKILGPNNPQFDSWSQSLRQGEAIHPFSDLTMAPVPLFFAVSVLTKAIENRLPGVWQVSGEQDISYAEACRLGARVLGCRANLVQPVPAASSGHYTGPTPGHTTLDTSRLTSELGLKPPEVAWTISTAFLDPPALGMVRESQAVSAPTREPS